MIQSKYSIKTKRTDKSTIDRVEWDTLPFGKVFSDHMLVMDYINGEWCEPEIIPFTDMKLHPATSAIHYGQSIFEGLKAYRTVDNEIAIFRPDMNAKRFQESCQRMCMPEMPTDLFEFCVEQIVDFDRNWIPKKDGYSLYIRPFMFATDDFIGIKPSEKYRFMIFTCPVGAYYSEPLNVKIEEKYTRAADGGVGRAKTAGNYAASLYPAKLGRDKGFHQLVWTDSKTHKYIEESGTMNIMFVIDGKLITPSEEGDTILPGITKRSVIEVAEDWGMPVEERKVEVEEVIKAIREGRLTEAFGAGTAATIAQIKMIGFRGEELELPPIPQRDFSNKVYHYLDDIKCGKVEDKHNWVKRI
ncbi:MAG: branched-chain amino acid aminotransferase [Brumimicrobium sp.]|nr:branched-chain amino acid aminotransferase [Brumimicrobium sp.]